MNKVVRCSRCKETRSRDFVTDGSGRVVEVTRPCRCEGYCVSCRREAPRTPKCLRCEPCTKAHNKHMHKEWRKEHGKEKNRLDYQKHREKKIAQAIEWGKKNPERYKKIRKGIYARKREHYLEKQREYYQKNRERKLAACRARYYANRDQRLAERRRQREEMRRIMGQRAA